MSAIIAQCPNPGSYSQYNLYNGCGYASYGHDLTVPSEIYAAAIDKIGFFLKKTGSPTGNAVVKIYAAGTAKVLLATSNTLDVSTLTTTMTMKDFTFAEDTYLYGAGRYEVMMEYTGGDSSNYVVIASASGDTVPGSFVRFNGTTSWSYFPTSEAIFYIYATVLLGLTLVDKYDASNYNAYTSLYGASGKVGQSFAVPKKGVLVGGASLMVGTVGSPTGNLYVRIFAHSGTFGESSVPTGSALVSFAVDVTTLNNPAAIMTMLSDGVSSLSLTRGGNYVLTLEYTGGDSSNYVRYAYDSSSPTHAGNFCSFNGSAWAADTAKDLVFAITGMSLSKPLITLT